MISIQLVQLNSDNKFPRDGEDVTVMGFGDTDKSDKMVLSPDLMEVGVGVISNSECGKARGTTWGHTYENQITKNMLCTEKKDKDACQGDSGGPLVVKGRDHDILVGVVSWGIGEDHCAFNTPLMFLVSVM